MALREETCIPCRDGGPTLSEADFRIGLGLVTVDLFSIAFSRRSFAASPCPTASRASWIAR